MSLSGLVDLARLQAKRKFVMPAQAGIHPLLVLQGQERTWIPACAGMTKGRVDFRSTNSVFLGLKPRVMQLLPVARLHLGEKAAVVQFADERAVDQA